MDKKLGRLGPTNLNEPSYLKSDVEIGCQLKDDSYSDDEIEL